MMVDQRAAGRFAIASGIVTILAAVVLVIFFLVEEPALVKSGNIDRITVFGSTNDALIALSLLLLVPVAVFVAGAGLPGLWQRLAKIVGVAGLTLGGVFQFVNALRALDYGTNVVLVGAAFTMVGLWLLAISVPGAARATFNGPSRWTGAGAGLSFLLIGLFTAIAGPSAVADPNALMSSPLLVAVLGAGTAGLHLVTPVWAILTGRRWLAANETTPD